MERIQLLITGLVQGVYYRVSTREKAQSLGLSGHVRNLADGRVEVVAEGPPEQVQALYDWCWQGPQGARVEHIEVRHPASEGALEHPFAVRR